VFESIIRHVIIDYICKNNLLNDSQHGFTAKQSCLTNLLIFLEEVTDHIDKDKPIDLDFQKSFR